MGPEVYNSLFRRMAGGNTPTPAYTVTVLKDKVPKGFYWMANTNKSYDVLKSILKKSGLVLEANKAPLEATKELKEYLDQTVGIFKDDIPGLVAPQKAIEISMVVMDLVTRDLVLEESMGEAMVKRYEEIMEDSSSQDQLRRSGRLNTPGTKPRKLKEVYETTPNSQSVGEHDHIFHNSPRENVLDDGNEDDNENDPLSTSLTDAVKGITETVESRKRRRDSAEEMLEAIKRAERTTEMIKGISAGCSEEIREEMNRAVIILQKNNQKLYEAAKTHNMELKKAVSNCFGEIKHASKRLDTLDFNAKEAAKQAKVSQQLLTEILKKLDKIPANPIPPTSSDKRSEDAKFYCSFCETQTHDTMTCRRKMMCFRCGDDDHKQIKCYWKDRTCRICQIKGHKVDVHNTKNVKHRSELLFQFPGKFLHFLQEGIVDGNDDHLPNIGGPSTRSGQYAGYRNESREEKRAKY